MVMHIAKFASLFTGAYISRFSTVGIQKRTIFFSTPTFNNFFSQPHKIWSKYNGNNGESSYTIENRFDKAAETDDQEFQKWCNGGGMFHKSASIDPTAQVEVGALVHSEAIVGTNVCISSGTIVGPSVTIGHSTITGYNVVLSNCTIGNSCTLHHGVCIGQDGFGFFVDEQGLMVKKPQNLQTRIGNHVEIGANTCVDRGSWRDTVIGDHTKIDNLVQIGHNVQIGKNCLLCGQVGIAGSVTIGDYVTIGGKAAVCDHVSIASKVRLAGASCVTKNISEAGDYGGVPAMPIVAWRKEVATLRQISKQFQQSKNR